MIWALHGFLGRSSDWDFLKTDLQPVDLYKDQADYETWAMRFNKQVIQAEYQKNYLLGYSMGGRLALHAFAENPELYDGVLLLSVHPGLPEDEAGRELRYQRQANDDQWALRFESEDWSQLMSDWDSQPVFSKKESDGQSSVKNPIDAPKRLEKSYDRKALAFCLREWSLAKQMNFIPVIKEHPDRFVFVQGQQDKKFAQIYHNLKKAVPDLMVIEVEGAGHRVLIDQPMTVASIVNDLCGSGG